LSGSIGQSALVGSSAIAPIAAGAMAAALPVIAPLLPFAGLISGLFGNDADDPIDALGRAAVNSIYQQQSLENIQAFSEGMAKLDAGRKAKAQADENARISSIVKRLLESNSGLSEEAATTLVKNFGSNGQMF